MPMQTHALDVYLRGTRNYVQGSQILGRTSDWLSELDEGALHLVSAKFSRITERGVIAVLDASDDEIASGKWIGQARYQGADTVKVVHFGDRDGIGALRIADVPSRLTNFRREGRLAGTATAKHDGSQEAFLASIIETVKRLHADLADDIADIWFTGLAQAQLPLSKSCGTEVSISISPLLERKQDGRLLTLTRVETTKSGTAIQPFSIGFSCRIKSENKRT